MLNLQPPIYATEIYKNDNSHYLTKQKGEKYIYRKHIHWLKLIKGRSKRPDSIRKFITSLIMSPLKEIGFSDE